MVHGELPATFTYSQARAAGLTKHQLYRLRDRGEVEAIGHGLYRQTSAPLADLAGLPPMTLLDHRALRSGGAALAVAGVMATSAIQVATPK